MQFSPKVYVFLQALTLLVGFVVFVFFVASPLTEGRAVGLSLVKIYTDPFILYLYGAALVFYGGLYQIFFTVGPMQTPVVGKLKNPSNAKTAPKGGFGFGRDDFERRALYPVFSSSRRRPSWIFGPGHYPKQCFSRGCSMGQCFQKTDSTSLTMSLRMGRWVGYRFLFLFRYAVAWGHGAGQTQ